MYNLAPHELRWSLICFSNCSERSDTIWNELCHLFRTGWFESIPELAFDMFALTIYSRRLDIESLRRTKSFDKQCATRSSVLQLHHIQPCIHRCVQICFYIWLARTRVTRVCSLVSSKSAPTAPLPTFRDTPQSDWKLWIAIKMMGVGAVKSLVPPV